jgi:hypothetical protein
MNVFGFVEYFVDSILQLFGFFTLCYLAGRWYIENFGMPEFKKKNKIKIL